MAGSLSDYLEQKLLNHTWGGNTGGAEVFTPPANLYLALFTVAPTDAGGGTEVTGGSYARKLVANTTAEWPSVAAGGTKSNANIQSFVTATANWGTIVAMAYFDAASGGNMLAWTDLAASKIINNTDTFRFAVGDLTIALS